MPDSYQVEGLYVEHVLPEGGASAGRPPVLLVHGAGHGAWCYELWMERLPELGWEAYAMSLRAHPGSYDVDEDTFLNRLRVDDYADDVEVVARHIGRPCLLMGHSMGGLVAQRFAERWLSGGESLAGLVLLASASPGQFGPLRPGPLPQDEPYINDRATTIQRYFHSTAPDVLERALARISPESPSVMNEYSLSPGVQIDPAAVTCPVLSVTAAYDGTTVPRDGRLAAFYGGQHLHLPDDGHDVMLEAGWAVLLEQVLRWAEDPRDQGMPAPAGGN